jgi:hypothetical protein
MRGAGAGRKDQLKGPFEGSLRSCVSFACAPATLAAEALFEV